MAMLDFPRHLISLKADGTASETWSVHSGNYLYLIWLSGIDFGHKQTRAHIIAHGVQSPYTKWLFLFSSDCLFYTIANLESHVRNGRKFVWID